MTILRPQTCEPAILEALAGAVAGTEAIHHAWRQSEPRCIWPHTPEQYAQEAQARTFWQMQASSDVQRYQWFIENGFGPLKAATWTIADRISSRDRGIRGHHAAHAHADVVDLLLAQSVILPAHVLVADLAGVSWR